VVILRGKLAKKATLSPGMDSFRRPAGLLLKDYGGEGDQTLRNSARKKKKGRENEDRRFTEAIIFLEWTKVKWFSTAEVPENEGSRRKRRRKSRR